MRQQRQTDGDHSWQRSEHYPCEWRVRSHVLHTNNAACKNKGPQHCGCILTQVVSLLVRRGCKGIYKKSARSQDLYEPQQKESFGCQKNADSGFRFLIKHIWENYFGTGELFMRFFVWSIWVGWFMRAAMNSTGSTASIKGFYLLNVRIQTYL